MFQMHRILRVFHFKNGKVKQFEETIYKDVNDVAKVVMFKGEIFEWTIWDSSQDENIDYKLIYTQVSDHRKAYIQVQEVISKDPDPPPKCDCGGAKSEGLHASWCSLLTDV